MIFDCRLSVILPSRQPNSLEMTVYLTKDSRHSSGVCLFEKGYPILNFTMLG